MEPGENDPSEDVKRCCTCKGFKPLTDFNRLAKASDGLQYSCRECNREWHRRNRVRHNRLIHARNKRVRIELKERMLDYLRDHPCVDCGESDPLVLEFDHLRDKTSDVCFLVTRSLSWRRALEEIAKCEVVCANCHRRRTYRRMNSYRLGSERNEEQ